jgi:CheY-like chemotaxis protein/anti-sigma regulatory factor (Ser/Thr protein kinase)
METSTTPEAVKLLWSSTPANIAVKQNVEKNLPHIIADPTQVHQVIMNLCTNAVQAMEDDGGELRVGLRETRLSAEDAAQFGNLQTGLYIELTVSDTGPGIPLAIQGSVFEPYVSAKERGQGTGLGLAIVRSIVENAGGGVRLESEPGRGATFTVVLPAVETEAHHEPADQAPLPAGSGHVLIVDDEPAIVDICREMLEGLGYTVDARTSPLEALELFRADPERFDAVITDQMMPHMTGDKLGRALQQIRPSMPIIVCSGYAHTISPDVARQSGIRTLVRKPILRRDLARAVASAIDEA